ncbi:related to General amino acid permease AGP1 [Saccharomycodes ludwigii]|uniref:Related to General amino acid permease AGP1 n=1 Tax=Saccharomycodes ludwigii TaxID=36035 RepID=A0A376B2P1_9ASCO|nr:hypothetical protein SCDLUD_003858 [Saccharomycodes ludwigii]KAH3899578.1 hypothetical protein SCDLUD_003858 [Saccharomycodes ludwigii]SSD58945.1 related to General amino acid permease AGP1 [Saccharomycodes ludwigii]
MSQNDIEKLSEYKSDTVYTFPDESIERNTDFKSSTKVEIESSEINANENIVPSSSKSYFQRFIDSFKPAPESSDGIEGAEKNLKQSIKQRHVIFSCISSGVGTGLLVGTAKCLHSSGPAGVVIGFAIISSAIYCIIQSGCEMAVTYSKVMGGFNTYPAFLIDPAFAFAVAFVYLLQWSIAVVPLELVTASITVKFWNDKINSDAFVVIFYVFVISINMIGTKGFAEADFIFNVCKVLFMIGFYIMGIVITCGGAGNDGYIGAKYWHNPGAFAGNYKIDHFKGVVNTFVYAAFAFGTSELFCFTAAEQSNPRKAISSGSKQFIYRILIIFLGSLVIVGFLVPYDSDELMGASGSATHASPFVLAASLHGVKIVTHFINLVILFSVISVSNSSFYLGSRLIMTFSKIGWAPRCLGYIDREGRPLIAIGICALFGLIAFVSASPNEEIAFSWLLAISSLSQVFTWSAMCLSHIRFRRAMSVQGRSLKELGFTSRTGVWGSYYSLFILLLVLLGQFWVALAPIGNGGKLDANNFFQNYLAMPILIAFYLGYKIWKKDWRLFIRAKDIDLNYSRNVFDQELIEQELFEEKERLKNSSCWVRISAFWC